MIGIRKTKREKFMELVRRSKFFPYRWIGFLGTAYIILLWIRSNSRVSSLEVFPNVKTRWVLGIWEYSYDCEDKQWGHFRSILVPLTVFFFLFITLSRVLRLAGMSLDQRKHIMLAVEIVVVYYLHGIFIFWMVLYLSIDFSFTFLVGRSKNLNRLMCVLTWIFPLSLLFFNEYYDKSYKVILAPAKFITNILPFLEYVIKTRQEYNFTIGFNLMMLRTISFNFDYFFSFSRTREFSRNRSKVDEYTNSDLPLHTYSFENYLLYCFYSPLYIAGPISSFNNFITWFVNPIPSILTKQNIIYFFRFLFSLVLIEVVNAKAYISSVVTHFDLIKGQVDVTDWLFLGIGQAIYLFLKFNTIWKYFRLISLLDGIDVYENMGACFQGFSSIRSFWRDWHTSFYKWNVRYIHVFLGGNQHPIRNSLLIFLFVAIWHDIHLNLLVYGWAVILLFLFEDLLTAFLHKNFPKKGSNKVWYHPALRIARISLIGPCFYLVINIGFSGLDQSLEMLKMMVSWRGILDLVLDVCNIICFQLTNEVIRTFTGKKISYKGEY